MTPEDVVQKQREALYDVLDELARHEPKKAQEARESADEFITKDMAKYPAEVRLYAIREMAVATSKYLEKQYGYEVTYDDRWVNAETGQLEQNAEMN